MIKVAWSPVYKYELPEGHRFPMEKYELIPEQLLYEGTISESDIFNPGVIEENNILLTHTKDFWEKLRDIRLSEKEIRRIGFPVNEKFIQRSRHISQGTIEGSLFALENGCALNVAGGTHHSFSYKAEAFCCLNDQAIASNFLLMNKLVSKILIIDLDVHQGNGTAEIFKNNSGVFTFSMHGEKNYPMHKEKSDLDIPLSDNMNDEEYLNILKNILPRLLDEVQPDFVFYLSGVDVLSSDKLGRLSLTKEGCKSRDRFVFETCKKNRLPCMVSMGGGYSTKISDIVDAHANTFREAAYFWG
jgi:acetoin utilization deacetylase AcuC-like enzyme